MIVEIQVWHLISLLISFLGFAFGAGKILLAQIEKRQAEMLAEQARRFTVLEKGMEHGSTEWARVERALLELKADLPRQYVMREDYVRGQAVLEAKLDALNQRLNALFLGGQGNG
ncbi:MAG: hypothetical protein LBE06_11700 [Azoarcus sp.]|jgi:hypothetical protein|nr:hypothetical protein [Azoarcus sp.]